MGRIPKELSYIKTAAIIVTAAVFMLIKNIPFDKKDHRIVKDKNFYYVTRVVDGDTLKISSGDKVRLIGVDTPEVHYSEKLVRDSRRSGMDVNTIRSLGSKASGFTSDLCLDKKISLEYDAVKRDKYGRLLAYVYLEDGTFVNAKILEEGYGQVMTVPPNVKYSEYFRKLERSARNGRKGLWKYH